MTAAQTERLSHGARARRKKGREGSHGPGAGYTVQNGRPSDQERWTNDGWLVRTTAFVDAGFDQNAGSILSQHADWQGPMKLVEQGGGVWVRREIFLGVGTSDGQDLLDEDVQDEFNFLRKEISDSLFTAEPNWTGLETKRTGWNPPDAKILAAWLGQAGHESAIDESQNLRLTLKSRGCDGQVRVQRDQGRLRLAMQLGQWKGLEPLSRQAMLVVAGRANRQTRLLRVAWLETDDAARCEAQVDLTGLPLDESLGGHGEAPRSGNAGAFGERLWRENLELSVAALQVALRQLGMELEVLAESRHRRLAELVLANAGMNVAPRQVAPAC